MLAVFSPIFVMNTKITFVYNLLAPLKWFRTKALYLLTYKTTTLFVLFCTKLLFRPTKINNFSCTKMLLLMKYCILCIRGLSPNFAFERSFKETNQQLLFPLKIPWFFNDFSRNKKLILILEAKSGDNS